MREYFSIGHRERRLLLSLSDVREDVLKLIRDNAILDSVQTGRYQLETRLQQSCKYQHFVTNFVPRFGNKNIDS